MDTDSDSPNPDPNVRLLKANVDTDSKRGRKALQGETRFTFAALNRLVKLDPATYQTWLYILRRVPASRLCLLAPDAALRGLEREAWAVGATGNVVKGLKVTERSHHMARIHRIDLALDTRLVGGGSTVLDLLWASVPLVTAKGDTVGTRFPTTALRVSAATGTSVESVKQYEDRAAALADG